MFNNYGGNDFSLQSGSPAIGVGTILASSYDQYPLPETTWPNPQLGTRSTSVAWDLGAFSTGVSVSQPSAPSSLAAIVN